MYYSRFKLITNNPIWRRYLVWAYNKCLTDLEKIEFKPNFVADRFVALLCGTSGEVTSSVFVDFVISKNPKAKIIILDISRTQLERSKLVLADKFPDADISYILADALETGLESGTINYIETDGFLEYFDKETFPRLLMEWKRLLKKDGFVTTRAFASNSVLGGLVDRLRLIVGKYYLGVGLEAHKLGYLMGTIRKAGFKCVQGGGTLVPTFRRFSLLK